jgi:hypothetical protein
MIQWLRHILQKSKPFKQHSVLLESFPSLITHNTPELIDNQFVWCLVGNVIGEHYSEGKKLYGTKHFSPNTKVFCFPPQWGDGYESIKIIGRHRKSHKNTCLIMPSKFITNWRLKKVHHPYILKVMMQENGWKARMEDKESILEMLRSLTNH